MRSKSKTPKRIWECGGENTGEIDRSGCDQSPEIKEIAGAKDLGFRGRRGGGGGSHLPKILHLFVGWVDGLN
jgi:hypothetical protein